MILAGYSPYSGSGTSSGIAALNCMDHLLYERDTLLITIGSNGGSGEVLLSNASPSQEEFLTTTGLYGLLRFWKAGQLNLHSIRQCAITLPYCHSQMDILTGRNPMNDAMFYEDLFQCLPELLATAGLYYQRIYLDLPSNPDSCKLFAVADLVFIFVTQDRRAVSRLDETSIQKPNVYYLLSRYDIRSFNNIFNYKRWFAGLRNRLIGVIPYETAYLDAWASGRVAEFFLACAKNSRKDPGGRMIQELKSLLSWIEKEEKHGESGSHTRSTEDRGSGCGSQREL